MNKIKTLIFLLLISFTTFSQVNKSTRFSIVKDLMKLTIETDKSKGKLKKSDLKSYKNKIAPKWKSVSNKEDLKRLLENNNFKSTAESIIPFYDIKYDAPREEIIKEIGVVSKKIRNKKNDLNQILDKHLHLENDTVTEQTEPITEDSTESTNEPVEDEEDVFAEDETTSLDVGNEPSIEEDIIIGEKNTSWYAMGIIILLLTTLCFCIYRIFELNKKTKSIKYFSKEQAAKIERLNSQIESSESTINDLKKDFEKEKFGLETNKRKLLDEIKKLKASKEIDKSNLKNTQAKVQVPQILNPKVPIPSKIYLGKDNWQNRLTSKSTDILYELTPKGNNQFNFKIYEKLSDNLIQRVTNHFEVAMGNLCIRVNPNTTYQSKIITVEEGIIFKEGNAYKLIKKAQIKFE